MKKINKSLPPNELTNYARSNPTDNWDDFKDLNQGEDYKLIRVKCFDEQGGLCGYCEAQVSELPSHKQRIEHYHSKSDVSGAKNWALDWNNVFGVCIGGNDSDKTKHPLPANLSCDSHKDHLIKTKKLPLACEGYYLNPLEIDANPNLFDFDKATGALKANQQACLTYQPTSNQYHTVVELVEKTIEILNLNCQRLLDERLKVLKSYNQSIKLIREKRIPNGHEQLCHRWFGTPWVFYFSTRRALLGNHAEKYLAQTNYQG